MKALQQILALACQERDHPWALATLVRTRGSTYRKPGARLLIAPDGSTTGVLSGGCLEEEIARQGLEVMSSHTPRLSEFDTRRLYGCEGALEVFIERIPAADETGGNFLTTVAEKIQSREICRTRTGFSGSSGFSEILPDKALIVESDDAFVQTLPLPVRLLLFGNGPEISPLRLFAFALGWTVENYCHSQEFPADFVPDDQTAAVVMTHQFGRDLAALERLLPLRLPYVGLLGPRRRHAELLLRFQEYRVLEPEWLETLHAPAGLDIGSEAPEEIALSIISEAAAVLAKRKGGFLCQKPAAIHASEIVSKNA